MKEKNKNIKIIITGGGTGGHVFPAISIADKLKELKPDAQILFIGSDNRLETTAVPKAGYDFKGLPVRGLQRKINLQFFDTVFRLMKSIGMAKKIIRNFKPDVVVGVGGYASAPVMYVANKKGIPTVIQEQNSFPGITNRRLATKASAICVAYEGMEKYFPADKLHFTGNPVRNLKTNLSQEEAREFFRLDSNKKTILVTGGSLGAKTINNSVVKFIEDIKKSDFQMIWQTGKRYFDDAVNIYEKHGKPANIYVTKFIDKMDLAYKAADLVISRAGAITISELALLGKAAIFVPSPNVAEDHQTKNAMALVKINAAEMIKDSEAEEKLIPLALQLIENESYLKKLSENILNYAKPDATSKIADIILQLAEKV